MLGSTGLSGSSKCGALMCHLEVTVKLAENLDLCRRHFGTQTYTQRQHNVVSGVGTTWCIRYVVFQQQRSTQFY